MQNVNVRKYDSDVNDIDGTVRKA